MTGHEHEENSFYMLINPLNRKLGTIYFAVISKVCNINENFQKLMTKLELYIMKFISWPKGINAKFVIRQHLHINELQYHNLSSYNSDLQHINKPPCFKAPSFRKDNFTTVAVTSLE